MNILSITSKIKEHQFLLEELIKRDFKKKYKRTILGMGWSVLAPLLELLVMALVFTQFFGRDTPHYLIYLFCGRLVFSFFTDATNGGMSTITGNASIFTKVNVPKYLFLFSRNLQAFVNFLLILVVFFIFVMFDGIAITWKFILLTYPIAMLCLLNVGVGMILSALFVFFRDMQYLYSIFTQLLMYFSAIFYQVDSYPAHIQPLFYLNPLYCFIKYFREIVIDSVVPSLALHGFIGFYSFSFFGIGCWMYKKYNTKFLYYV